MNKRAVDRFSTNSNLAPTKNDVVNKINYYNLLFSQHAETKSLVRSDELSYYNKNIYEIIFKEIVQLNKDLINIILDYFEDSLEFFYTIITGYPRFMYCAAFFGNYVTILINSYEIRNGFPYDAIINIKENIGTHYYHNLKIVDFNDLCNNTYNYGKLCSQVKIYNNDGSIEWENNDFIDDISRLLYNFKGITQHIILDWFTQIRQGKDITEKASFADIINRAPNDYFFVSCSTKTNEGCLIRLSEYEFMVIINEIKEINRVFTPK
jgi:hypothetical protein